jgi:Xaa-Pro aminopeptidase
MDNKIYKSRRESLNTILPKNCALIIPGADLQYRNADSSYALRQESSFYYFSGFCEPSSLMVMVHQEDKISSIVFVPPKDKLREIWDGYRAGPIGAVDDYGFDQAFDNTKIDELMPELLQGVKKVFYPIGKKSGFDQNVIDWTCAASSKDRHSQSIDIMDGSSMIGNMRLIKDDHEIEIMKKACDISAESFVEVMKNIKPGENEQLIESKFLYEFGKRGGRFPAYTPIVAGGENACVLHYIENNQDLNESDLILVDAGCEYKMYASDITRTFPVGGSSLRNNWLYITLFLRQIRLQLMQLKLAIILWNLNLFLRKLSQKVLVELGILNGNPEELHKEGAFKDFYMHKIGHWLGLDVHDVGDYMEDGEFMQFKPGMITTIEPGIYISKLNERR